MSLETALESLRTAVRGRRVVLGHDWLTGMRGGERCLELLCRAFPDAPLATLLANPASVSDAVPDAHAAARLADRDEEPDGCDRGHRWLLQLPGRL